MSEMVIGFWFGVVSGVMLGFVFAYGFLVYKKCLYFLGVKK